MVADARSGVTASERLRELDGAVRLGPWRFKTEPVPNRNHASVLDSTAWPVACNIQDEDAELLTVLRNVLPLIADQTETAEAVLHEYDLWAEDANDGEFAIWSRDEFMASFLRLRSSLTALREHLEQQNVTGGDTLRDEGIHDAFDANTWD